MSDFNLDIKTALDNLDRFKSACPSCADKIERVKSLLSEAVSLDDPNRVAQILDEIYRLASEELSKLQSKYVNSTASTGNGNSDVKPPQDPPVLTDVWHWAMWMYVILLAVDIATTIYLVRKSDTAKEVRKRVLGLIGLCIGFMNIVPEFNTWFTGQFERAFIDKMIGREGYDLEPVGSGPERVASELSIRGWQMWSDFVGLATTFAAWTAIPSQIAMVLDERIGAGLMGYFDALYWGLGLCYTTWMASGPILMASVARPLEYFANFKWRTRLLSPNQYIRAYRRGYISEEELKYYLALHGYTGRSIEILVKQAREDRIEDQVRSSLRLLRRARQFYQPFSPTQLAYALAYGIVDESEAKLELALQGRYSISSEEIEKYIREVAENLEKARKAPWIEFVKFRSEVLKRTTVARQKLYLKWQGTLSQLIDATAQGVVTDDEFEQWLKEAGFDERYIKYLKLRVNERRTGRRRPRRLSVTWLMRLYRYGIVSLDFIKSYLIAKLGYEEADAELIVRYIERRYGSR